MVKFEDPKEPSCVLLVCFAIRKGSGATSGVLNLRGIMIALVYFALVFWAARGVMADDPTLSIVMLAVLIGLGLASAGLWAALRMSRFAIFGWVLFVIGYMAITAATISGFAIPALPILIGAIVFLSLRRRSTNQDALLWVLNVGAIAGMPLKPGVRAFAGQSRGLFHIWANSLADLLQQGESLAEAVERIPKVVSPASTFLIRMGQESGDVAAGLRAATLARSSRSPALEVIGARIAYLVGLVLVSQSIVGFVLYFIVPKLEAIFRDFGIELPQVTILVIQASHVAVENFYLLSFPVVGLLIYLPFFLHNATNAGLPLVDRLFPRRHTILILRALAVVIDAGRPVAPALRWMAHWYPTGWVRRRLGQASGYAEEGVDWADALELRGLLTRNEAGVLQSASRAGNLRWALLELADSSDRRRAYSLQVWSQWLFVATILLLGVLIFVIAVAFFTPLTTLILRLAQ